MLGLPGSPAFALGAEGEPDWVGFVDCASTGCAVFSPTLTPPSRDSGPSEGLMDAAPEELLAALRAASAMTDDLGDFEELK